MIVSFHPAKIKFSFDLKILHLSMHRIHRCRWIVFWRWWCQIQIAIQPFVANAFQQCLRFPPFHHVSPLQFLISDEGLRNWVKGGGSGFGTFIRRNAHHRMQVATGQVFDTAASSIIQTGFPGLFRGDGRSGRWGSSPRGPRDSSHQLRSSVPRDSTM